MSQNTYSYREFLSLVQLLDCLLKNVYEVIHLVGQREVIDEIMKIAEGKVCSHKNFHLFIPFPGLKCNSFHLGAPVSSYEAFMRG